MFGDLFAPSLTRTALSPAIARSTVQTQNAPYEALLSRGGGHFGNIVFVPILCQYCS